MAGKIDDEMMEAVAILAQLSIREEEKDAVREEMERMLDFVDQLNELDTVGTEPALEVISYGNVFREDEVTNGNEAAAMLANAPQKQDGQYQVPKTVE